MKTKRIFLSVVAMLIFAIMAVGCTNSALNGSKVKKSIFTEGDYVCMPNEDKTITILELSDQGKQKEVLVIPEFIGGKKVVSLGGRVYGGSLTEKEEDRFHSFSSETLKKLYIPFAMENQWVSSDDELVYGNTVDIPNAVIVASDETTAVTYANPGFVCKNIILPQDRVELYNRNFSTDIFLAANVIYCEYNESATEVLWLDYTAGNCPVGYVPEFPKKEEESLVAWYTDIAKTQPWDGEISGGITLYAQYGYTDGTVWGVKNQYDDKISLLGFVFGTETQQEELKLPDRIEGKEVDGIGSNAFGNGTFKSVTIPDSVTYIGSNAFADCTALRSVTFGADSRCLTIWTGAFNGCTALTSFTAPDSLIDIWGAFCNCTALTSVHINGAAVAGGAFVGCASLEEFGIDEGNTHMTVDGGALYGMADAGKVLVAYACGATASSYTILADCVRIEAEAFKGNTHLTAVDGGGLLSIDESAFENCTALKTIDFTVKGVGRKAFKNCSSLEGVTLRGNGAIQLGFDIFLGTTEECCFYVHESKVEEFLNSAELLGILGTVSAIR